MTAHKDLGVVLVQGTLVVSNSGHVLDDDSVIRVFTFLVQDGIGSDHVINHVGLGDLLGAELFLGAQVLAVVVAKMVVACNRGQLDTGIDQKVDQSGLHLRLAGLEVITSNEGIVLLGKLHSTRDERILRRTIDKGSLLQSASNGEDGRGRYFLVTLLNSPQQVISGVVHSRDDIGVAFGVGGP